MAVEDLSIFVEICLHPEVLKNESRIQDASEMLNFIDYLNKSNILTEDCILVSFDIFNLFPSIDNQSGLPTVKKVLEVRQEQFPPTDSIIEVLKLCLESRALFLIIYKLFLQTDGTVCFMFKKNM